MFLVTGATGFLGGHLCRALLEHGHHVVALCREDERSRSPFGPSAAFGGPQELEELGVGVRRGDVLDAASVREAARGCEGVFHCAGKVSRDRADAEMLYAL